MNKKIAMSFMSITAALLVMGGATYAAFTSSATTTNNTFASGNASLVLAPDTGAGEPEAGLFAAEIAGAIFNDVFPGFDDRHLFWMKNASESPIDLSITADLMNLDQDPDNTDVNAHLDENLLIRWACDTSGNGDLEPEEFGAEFTVRQWLSGGNSVVGTLTPDEAMICGMYSRVPASATNDIAGETISFDAKYDATQVVAP